MACQRDTDCDKDRKCVEEKGFAFCALESCQTAEDCKFRENLECDDEGHCRDIPIKGECNVDSHCKDQPATCRNHYCTNCLENYNRDCGPDFICKALKGPPINPRLQSCQRITDDRELGVSCNSDIDCFGQLVCAELYNNQKFCKKYNI